MGHHLLVRLQPRLTVRFEGKLLIEKWNLQLYWWRQICRTLVPIKKNFFFLVAQNYLHPCIKFGQHFLIFKQNKIKKVSMI